MMNTQQQVISAIYRAIDDVNMQLAPANQLKKEPQTVLFGRHAGLDSLGLVNLIVELERHIERDLGKSVSLTDPDLLTAAESPFSTVQTLAHHIVSRLE